MSKLVNHLTAAYKAAFPITSDFKGSIYLTQNLIRKSVEQAQWLISQKEKDIALLVQDGKILAGADQAPDEGTLAICAKYGAVRGAMHYDDIALDRIDERVLNLETEVSMLEQFIEAQKEAFKAHTGDTFTEKSTPAAKPLSDAKRAALRAKYAA